MEMVSEYLIKEENSDEGVLFKVTLNANGDRVISLEMKGYHAYVRKDRVFLIKGFRSKYKKEELKCDHQPHHAKGYCQSCYNKYVHNKRRRKNEILDENGHPIFDRPLTRHDQYLELKELGFSFSQMMEKLNVTETNMKQIIRRAKARGQDSI